MATITATADASNLPPRMQLDVTGASGTLVTITRTDPDGNIRPVRAAEPGPLTSGAATVYDYESPFDPAGTASLTYTMSSDGGSTGSVTVAALKVQQSWLIHPGVPDLSQPINGITIGQVATESGATLHQPLGRKYPIPVSDGVRKARTFNLVLKTRQSGTNDLPLFPSASLYPSGTLFPSGSTFTAGNGPWLSSTAALWDLFEDTAPLLLQLAYPYTAATWYRWVNIGTVTEDRISMNFGDPYRILTLACTEVDRPAGGVAAQRTYTTLLGEDATYTAVTADYTTYHGVLTGVHGT